jgi:hypothetical protein
MATMIGCPSCSKSVPVDARVCPYCATAMPVRSTAPSNKSRRALWVVLGLIVVVITVALAGCASTHMKQYLGKDVRYIAVDEGAPVNVLDMPDGRRAFQYRWGGGTVTTPRMTTTTGQILRLGNQAWYTEQALETGGQTITT